MFAVTKYKEKHGSAAKILHQELADKLTLLQVGKVPYYKYNPEPIRKNNEFKLYWDQTVLTDQIVVHNRPEIILTDKNSRRTTSIDIPIPNNHNLRPKYNEKNANPQTVGNEQYPHDSHNTINSWSDTKEPLAEHQRSGP